MYGTLLAKFFTYMKMQIAKLLVKEDILSLEQIKEAIERKYNSDMELSEALIELGYITEPELMDFLGKSYGVPVISIEDHSVDQEVLELIPSEIAIENRLIPLSITGSALTVAMSDPSNLILVDKLNFLTGKNIIPVVVSERSIIDMLTQYYGYSKNQTDFSELSLKPTGYDDIDELVRELEVYKNGDTSEVDKGSNTEVEDHTQSTLTQESLHAEQVESENDIPLVSDANEEHIDESETDVIHHVGNDHGIFEDSETQDEDQVSNESGDVFSQNLFINAPDNKDFAEVSEDQIQNGGDTLEETNKAIEEPVELTSSSQGLNSIDEPFAARVEPEFETQQQASTLDAVDTNYPSSETTPNDINSNGINKNVLVIDNSRTVQKLITLALNRQGYSVSAVSDGMEALSCLNDVKPGLIFIEINLPHMDGYQVCKIIKSHGLMKQVPIIMLSAKDGLVDKVRSKMAGANGNISKPFAASELVEAAQRFTSSNATGLISGQS